MTGFSAQAELVRAQDAQGHAQKCSQVKAAPAHVQRLERN